MEIKKIDVLIDLSDYIQIKQNCNLTDLKIYYYGDEGIIIKSLENGYVLIRLLNVKELKYIICKISDLRIYTKICIYDDIKDNLKYCIDQELPFIKEEDGCEYLINSEDD